MDMPTTLSLEDRLRRCCTLWCEAHDAKPGRLGRLVVNDGGFFARLESPGATTTTATLEKFARFLADPANWPDGNVPREARDLAHVTGVPSVAPSTLGTNGEGEGYEGDSAPSAGIAGETSPLRQAQGERTERDAA
jgi:hypothetical protein